jgi:hypothetical protein
MDDSEKACNHKPCIELYNRFKNQAKKKGIVWKRKCMYQT